MHPLSWNRHRGLSFSPEGEVPLLEGEGERGDKDGGEGDGDVEV